MTPRPISLGVDRSTAPHIARLARTTAALVWVATIPAAATAQPVPATPEPAKAAQESTATPPVTAPEATKPEATKPETTKPETTKPETTKPEAAAKPASDEARERAEAFLGELEKTATTISSMSGTLTLEKFDALGEETDQRTGRLVLDRKDGKRRIAIRFEEYIDGSGRLDRSVLHYIVADGWLCEIDHTNKSFTKRQIARPGEEFDPLALGNGPVPLPIGQKKADVLARFDVTETEIPADIPLLGSLQDVAAMRLVPKSGSEAAQELENVDLFYDRTTLAPVGVVMREKNGNRTVARVTKPVVNGDVKPEDRALLEIPALDPKEWAHDVKPLANPD
ncbi:MAG: hypothetical protein LW806_09780 [Planctomycetaceae bacterium]|nr:hypothetical protein [Planctomycetaceae bacterium]